jgi:hypothetical protein
MISARHNWEMADSLFYADKSVKDSAQGLKVTHLRHIHYHSEYHKTSHRSVILHIASPFEPLTRHGNDKWMAWANTNQRTNEWMSYERFSYDVYMVYAQQ